MAAEVARQWREEEEMAPAVRRRAHEARQRHCPVLLLAQEMGEPNARQQILLRLLVNLLANLFRNEIRAGGGGRRGRRGARPRTRAARGAAGPRRGFGGRRRSSGRGRRSRRCWGSWWAW